MVNSSGKLSKNSNQSNSILRKIQENQKAQDEKMNKKYDEILNELHKNNLVRKK